MRPSGHAALTPAAIDERSGVAGVVQHLQHPVVAQGKPRQGSLVGPGLDPRREREGPRRRRL